MKQYNKHSSPTFLFLYEIISIPPVLNRPFACHSFRFYCLNLRFLLIVVTFGVFLIPISICRASQKLNLASPQRRKRHGSSDGAESPIPAAVHRFGTDFSGLLRRNPPPPPPHLLRRLGLRENPGVGKVSLLLKTTYFFVLCFSVYNGRWD